MPDIEQQIADHLSDLVRAAMTLQGMRFQEDWEPHVVRALGDAADLCLPRLKEITPQLQGLPDSERTLARLRMKLGRAFAAVVSRQTEATKDILRRMVREESAATGEALSLGGLIGAPPEIAGQGRGHAQLIDHLACCQPLDQAVSESLLDFTGRLAAELAGAADGRELMGRLELMLGAWRGSLERIARTILHQSVTLLRQAVSAAMA